jgi:UrcA family protein
MIKLSLAAIAAALLAASGATQNLAPAAASQLVSYDDLDLTTQSGQRALDRRIRAAVQTVCGSESSADPRGRHRVRDCRDETLAQANLIRDRAVASANGTLPTRLASQQ